MRNFGALLAIFGLIWGVVAFNMSTIVETESRTIGSGEYAVYIPSLKVHNLDLSERRRTHLMISGFLAVVGTVLFGFGSVRNSGRSALGKIRICPFCAESIKIEAIVCRFCSHELPSRVFPSIVQHKSDNVLNEISERPAVHAPFLIGIGVVVIWLILFGLANH